MKKNILLSIIVVVSAGCSNTTMNKRSSEPVIYENITSNSAGAGPSITIEFTKGESFYYPLFAIWLEDNSGNYIQTLYVAKSVATGVFRFGQTEGGEWISSVKRAPQTLPYWAHKRGVKAADGLYVPDSGTMVPDAYTGATPVSSFILNTRADSQLPEKCRILLEVNQNWDWNEFWTNDKFPDDENYKMSCQPAVLYEALIDPGEKGKSYIMSVTGHSHYSGKTGELYPDITTLTTALTIAKEIKITIN